MIRLALERLNSFKPSFSTSTDTPTSESADSSNVMLWTNANFGTMTEVKEPWLLMDKDKWLLPSSN